MEGPAGLLGPPRATHSPANGSLETGGILERRREERGRQVCAEFTALETAKRRTRLRASDSFSGNPVREAATLLLSTERL